MKKITLFALLTFLSSQLLNAQCTTNASGFGNNTSTPMYNVQGTVQVVLNNNNTVSLNLMSNFSTAAGPDVRIFLVDRGTLTNAQLKITSNFLNRPRILMGISPASGATSYTVAIPAGMNITEFETVYFYCQAFSQFWDYGSFTAFTSSNCSVLGNSEFENNKLQLFPNPTNSEVNINLDTNSKNYNIAIYNILGRQVYATKPNQSAALNKIDISSFNAGVYIVQITDQENNIYQKRLIKN